MACYVFYQFHAQLLVHKCYNFDCHGDGVHCLITLWGLSQDLLEIYDETNDMPKATPNYVASIPPPPISSNEILSGLSDKHPPSHLNPLIVTRLLPVNTLPSLMTNTILCSEVYSL